MSERRREFTKGIFAENPVFGLMLGLCPTLAVTTSLENGLGMGVAGGAVLICSNVVISLIRKWVPDKIRIPIFIVVIASFVTMVDLVMAAFTPGLHKELGLFIPLIVVNCIILGRAEAFASKNGVVDSFLDGLGMTVGFTWALALIGAIREIFGTGALLGIPLSAWPIAGKLLVPFEWMGMSPAIMVILPPGAFIIMGFLMAYFQGRRHRREVGR